MRYFSRIAIAATTFLLLSSSLTLAATKKPKLPDKFPPNPLEIRVLDPLLPNFLHQQPLTSQERENLETQLNELNQQAADTLKAGNKQEAFDIWNREIRLRRYLGPLTEVQALSRVGGIAWRENDRQEVQYITERSQTIQKQPLNANNLQLLQALGQVYQEVRSPNLAALVYNQVLAIVTQRHDIKAEVETLNTIAALNTTWFNYPQAAAAYEELLKISASTGDTQNQQLAYLQQLAYIFEQAQQPQEAVNTLNQLVKIYARQNDLTQLPALKIAIGSNYEVLAKQNPNLLKEAFNNYQQAYTTAWQLQQYDRSGEALQKLITLYRSQGQINEALQVSQILVQAEEQAANSYGLINAYDQVGQINLERKDYPQARAAFEKGLELAQQLNYYNQSYFTEQIQKLPKVKN